MSIIAELKRRKVVRTTAAYIAAAFITAQGVQLLVEGLDLPSWILQAVLVLLLAALPVVIGLAWAFDITSEGVERTANVPSTSTTAMPWRRFAIMATASAVILLASLAYFVRDGGSAELDQNLVAVLPFRVSGDQQIEYLREGMVDMLAAKLTGEGGPRSADPRAVGNAVRQHGEGEGEVDVAEADAADIARRIGAGQVLIGSVVGTHAQFTIYAKLLRVPGGQVLAQAEQSGSSDSLLTTVDQLVARLLSLQAGEGPQSLSALTTTSLPALRAYLDGRLEYRNGRFGKASERFANALDADSTFALAGLGLWMTSTWGEGPATDGSRTARLIANHRDRLGAVDRAMADAIVGKEWPQPRSQKQRRLDWEAAVKLAPDRPDAWFWYADAMHHYGAITDVLDATEQSDVLFSRVLELDSTYMPALFHRIDNAIRLERLDTLARLESIRKGRDPSNAAGQYQHSFRIRMVRDSAAIRAELSGLDTLPVTSLMRVSEATGLTSGTATEAVRALEIVLKRTLPASERSDALWDAALSFLGLGMPTRAQQVFEELIALDSARLPIRTMQVLVALYWDGDSTAARAAARDIEALLPTQADGRRRVQAACALEQWRVLHDDVSTVAATIAQFNELPADNISLRNDGAICAQTLAVLHAVMRDPARLPPLVSTLNNMVKDAPSQGASFRNATNIVLARAAERIGDRALAHRAVSRIAIARGTTNFWSTMQREQARLAALTGKKDEAILLYRRYLMAHELAEPAIKQQDEAVRAHLAQLTGER